MSTIEEVSRATKRILVEGFTVDFRHGPKDGILCEIAIVDTECVVEGYDEHCAWSAFFNALDQIDVREA